MLKKTKKTTWQCFDTLLTVNPYYIWFVKFSVIVLVFIIDFSLLSIPKLRVLLKLGEKKHQSINARILVKGTLLIPKCKYQFYIWVTNSIYRLYWIGF